MPTTSADTLSADTKTVAYKLITETFYSNGDTQDVEAAYLFPSDTEIRLVYADSTARPSPDPHVVKPFYFGADAASGVPFRSAVALIHPEEVKTLQPPEGWGTWKDAIVYQPG